MKTLKSLSLAVCLTVFSIGVYAQQTIDPTFPHGATGFIRGTLFNDVDSNCVFDPLIDFIISNRIVEARPVPLNNGSYYGVSDNNGDYKMKVLEGDYEIRQVKVKNDIFREFDCPSTDSVYFKNISEGDDKGGNDFFNVLKQQVCDAGVTITPTYTYPYGAPCNGITHEYCVSFTNNGQAITGVSFTINLDANVTIVGTPTASPDCDCTPVISGPQTVTCTPPGAFPANKNCIICIDVVVPFGVPLGTILTTTATLDGKCPGNTTFIRTDAITEVVDCSQDPNDKLVVSPEGCGPFGNIPRGEALTYQIRFQNTGTAPATFVFIKDILDSDLDITTFKFLGASHPLTQIQIIPDNELIFSFIGINLPDSLSDPEGSQGFVVFSIEPKDNLPNGTEITNTAGIIFDLNVPVITNTTLSTIRDNPFPIADFEANNSCSNLGLMFDFTYTGGTSDGATFEWDFGADATPLTSTDENPTGIVYSSSGQKQVTLTITRFGCTSSITKTVNVMGIDVTCGKNNNKVLVCHTPPGNPGNSKTICINSSSLSNHLAHGDCIGACTQQSKTGNYWEESDDVELQSDGEKQMQIENLPLQSIFKVHPNPFEHTTTISFVLPESDNAQLDVYNYMGQHVATLFNGSVNAGQLYEVEFIKDTPAGVYFGVLHTTGERIITKLLVINNF